MAALTAFLVAFAAQAALMSLRSSADAMLGAAPLVDAGIAAAGLSGAALGALLPARPRLAAAAQATLIVVLLGVVHTWPLAGIQLSARLVFSARVLSVAVVGALLCTPVGVVVRALVTRGGGVYAADLGGAALGVLGGVLLTPTLGALPLLTLAATGAAIATVLVPSRASRASRASRPLPAEAAPARVAVPAGPLAAAVACALAAGVVEVTLPRVLAQSTAAAAWPFAAGLLGVLVGGTFGVRRIPPTGIAALLWPVALVLVLLLRAPLMTWLSLVDVPAPARLLVAALAVATPAALAGAASGAAIAPLLGSHARVALSACSGASAVAALGGALILDELPPLPVLVALCAAAAAVSPLVGPTRGRRLPALVAAGAAAACVALGLLPSAPLATDDLSRRILFPDVPARAPRAIVIDEHDLSGRVTIAVDDDLVLFRDGKPDASLLGDADTQTLLAVAPTYFIEKPRRVLVVGLGLGTTASVLAGTGADVTVVELSRVVHESVGPRMAPNVTVVRDDMRTFLSRAAPGTWDVITAEPTNLFVGGVSRAVTIEALEQARRALRSDGVLVLWTHAYLATPELLEILARNVQAVFPAVTALTTRTDDVLLVASSSAMLPDPRRAEASLGPALGCALHQLGHASAGGVLRRRVELPLSEGPLHTDARPVLAAEALRGLLEGTVVPNRPWPVSRDAREAVADGSGGLAALEARVARDGALSATEVVSALGSPAGRKLLVERAASVRLEDAGDDDDPAAVVVPHAAKLARAGLAALGQTPTPALVIEAIDGLGRSCPTEADWQIATALALDAGRRVPTQAQALALALLDPALPRVLESTRAKTAAALCADAVCCAAVAERTRALGRDDEPCPGR